MIFIIFSKLNILKKFFLIAYGIKKSLLFCTKIEWLEIKKLIFIT